MSHYACLSYVVRCAACLEFLFFKKPFHDSKTQQAPSRSEIPYFQVGLAPMIELSLPGWQTQAVMKGT